MPRISQLNDLDTPASNDVLVLVDQSTGQTKKVLLSDLLGIPDLGWTSAAETWTYSSWSSTTRIGVLTAPSDATTKYQAGNRIKITQSTGGTKYGIIHEVTATTITIFFPSGTTLNNEAITDNFFSTLDSPLGFDKDALLWELKSTLGSAQDTTSTTPVNTSMPNLALGKGAWQVIAQGSHYTTRGSTTFANGNITLSTSSTGQEDSEMTRYIRIQGASGTLASEASFAMIKNVDHSAATTYYLNHWSSAGSITHRTFAGASIRAVSRYL